LTVQCGLLAAIDWNASKLKRARKRAKIAGEEFGCLSGHDPYVNPAISGSTLTAHAPDNADTMSDINR
jgi:hypothetical protein